MSLFNTQIYTLLTRLFLEDKKYERQTTEKKRPQVDEEYDDDDDKSKLIDELIGFQADSKGYNIELNRVYSDEEEDQEPKKLVKLGTVNEKIDISKFDNHLSPEYSKKRSINPTASPFSLKEFVDNPSKENISKLKSMNIKDIMQMYKKIDTKHRQKFESELIKVQSKNDKELFPILKTITEFSRFNSPVVKLGGYVSTSWIVCLKCYF